LAANQQAQGIDQVNQAVGGMDQVTQQIAANAQQSARAAEEMSAMAAQLKAMVYELISFVNGGGATQLAGWSAREEDRSDEIREDSPNVETRLDSGLKRLTSG
jgi:ABC-type transporter Mla subunit MlaD